VYKNGVPSGDDMFLVSRKVMNWEFISINIAQFAFTFVFKDSLN